MRRLSRRSAVGFGAAGAAIALAVGPVAAASAATAGFALEGNAFGEYIAGPTGQPVSGPAPEVTLPQNDTSGTPVSQTLAQESYQISVLGITVPVLSTGKLTVTTTGTGGYSSSLGSSYAEVTTGADVQNVSILGGKLTIADLSSTCTSTYESSGGINTVGMNIGSINGGTDLVTVNPDTTISYPGVGTAVFNKQTRTNTASGSEVNVDAMDLTLDDGSQIVIAESHCFTAPENVTVPVDPAGGFLLAGLVGAGFVMYQWRRRPAR